MIEVRNHTLSYDQNRLMKAMIRSSLVVRPVHPSDRYRSPTDFLSAVLSRGSDQPDPKPITKLIVKHLFGELTVYDTRNNEVKDFVRHDEFRIRADVFEYFQTEREP